MLDNPYLDTIISMVLVFALLSTLVSLILEAWNQRIKERGVFLQKTIFRLLDDPLNFNYGYHLYQHPIINRMRKDGSSYPYYISADSFCNALIDTLADLYIKPREVLTADGGYTVERPGSGAPLSTRFRQGVLAMNESDLKRLFRNFIDRSLNGDELDFDKLKTDMGKWYDDYMDRTTGEFKNNQRGKLRIIGLTVALVLNVDSFHVARVFMMDKPLRDSTVRNAERVVDHRDEKDTSAMAFVRAAFRADTSVRVRHKIDSLGRLVHLDSLDLERAAQADSVLALIELWRLPVGWDRREAPLVWFLPEQRKKDKAACPQPSELARVSVKRDDLPLPPPDAAMMDYITKRNTPGWASVPLWLIGVFISGYALSFGAPFWFETLVKLINIRRAGLKPARKDAND